MTSATGRNQEYLKVIAELKYELDYLAPSLRSWNQKYYDMHQNRYLHDLQLLEQYYHGGDILEIGSLPCHLTVCLKKLGYPVIGLDIDPDRAKELIARHQLTVIKNDIEHEPIPFADNSFALILFNEIFEHLRINPIATLQEINRVLKPDGVMILTTPNLYFLKRIIQFNLGRGIGSAYQEFEKLRLLGHMGHVREYSSRDLREFLRNTGFDIIKLQYQFYDRAGRGLKTYLLNLLKRLCFAIPYVRPYLVVVSRRRV